MHTVNLDIALANIAQMPPGDVRVANCPSRNVIQMLAEKWAMLILDSLRRGPVRFGALRKRIDGVTKKMLTQTLRSLERDGLVSRTVYATAPPSVEYALTPLGDSVVAITEQLCRWSEHNMKAVLIARCSYDVLSSEDAQRALPARW